MKESLIDILKKSPIKYKSPKKHCLVTGKSLSSMLISRILKNKLFDLMIHSFAVIKKVIPAESSEKEIKCKIHSTSKYLKTSIVQLKLIEYLRSFIKSYQKILIFQAFKSLQHIQAASPKSLLLILSSLIHSRLRFSLTLLKENQIGIHYLDKRLKIEAKLKKKRFSSAFSLLLSLEKNHLSRSLLKILLYNQVATSRSVHFLCHFYHFFRVLLLKKYLYKLKP